MNNKQYKKQFILREICANYGFEKIDLHQGSSLILDCSFYKTNHEGIYITDYDFKTDTDLEEKDVSNLLYRKDGVRHLMILSNTLLKDKSVFEMVLCDFKNEWYLKN
jgi:hypothetical protein